VNTKIASPEAGHGCHYQSQKVLKEGLSGLAVLLNVKSYSLSGKCENYKCIDA
jgi:hypothetical protein